MVERFDAPQLHHRLRFLWLCLKDWGLLFCATILQTILWWWCGGCGADGVWGDCAGGVRMGCGGVGVY